MIQLITARRVLVSLHLLLLCACSHTYIEPQDGPPDNPVDISHIANAAPQVTQPCRYGNPASYQVNTKVYHVLASSKDYHKIGLASWYGKKFHGHRTSCGEPYDMLAMTAASKTLPLPTYVKVINLANRRAVIVKVNDRGPFHEDRILDLSYAAAKKLGMVNHGTAKVEVIALDPTANSQAAQSYIQVGAFHNHSYAHAHLETIKIRLSNSALPIQIKQADNIYRVLIGPFNSATQQQQLKKQLMALNMGRILEVFS